MPLLETAMEYDPPICSDYLSRGPCERYSPGNSESDWPTGQSRSGLTVKAHAIQLQRPPRGELRWIARTHQQAHAVGSTSWVAPLWGCCAAGGHRYSRVLFYAPQRLSLCQPLCLSPGHCTQLSTFSRKSADFVVSTTTGGVGTQVVPANSQVRVPGCVGLPGQQHA